MQNRSVPVPSKGGREVSEQRIKTESGVQSMPIVIAVDGPAGSGKSSLCQAVARRLGWTYVNTGAIYRAIGYLALEAGIDLSDEQALCNLVESQGRHLAWQPETGKLYLGDDDVSGKLHTEEVGKAASSVAKVPGVRSGLLPIQRNWAMSAPVGAIIDGRDIGTVVFPKADLKVFLTASIAERARRRVLQLGEQSDANLEEIKLDIERRDAQDSGRSSAPLREADDAVRLDTSDMDFAQSVDAIVDLIAEKGLAGTN